MGIRGWGFLTKHLRVLSLLGVFLFGLEVKTVIFLLAARGLSFFALIVPLHGNVHGILESFVHLDDRFLKHFAVVFLIEGNDEGEVNSSLAFLPIKENFGGVGEDF